MFARRLVAADDALDVGRVFAVVGRRRRRRRRLRAGRRDLRRTRHLHNRKREHVHAISASVPSQKKKQTNIYRFRYKTESKSVKRSFESRLSYVVLLGGYRPFRSQISIRFFTVHGEPYPDPWQESQTMSNWGSLQFRLFASLSTMINEIDVLSTCSIGESFFLTLSFYCVHIFPITLHLGSNRTRKLILEPIWKWETE